MSKSHAVYLEWLLDNEKKRLHITMSYVYVGDVSIDLPEEILEGSEEEKLQVAFDYAKQHIDEIPVAENAEYISDSDNFALEDISWENES